jgi:DUF309 family protein family protein
MAEPTATPAAKRPRRRPAAAGAAASASVQPTDAKLPRGRTPPLDEETADVLFRRGVALFNGVRYWHAHEAWEILWRAAADEERDFYQGLIQLAAGLLHVQRREARGARRLLGEGLAKLRRYVPAHRGIIVGELLARCEQVLDDLDAGFLPYLIPPVIRFTELDELESGR